LELIDCISINLFSDTWIIVKEGHAPWNQVNFCKMNVGISTCKALFIDAQKLRNRRPSEESHNMTKLKLKLSFSEWLRAVNCLIFLILPLNSALRAENAARTKSSPILAKTKLEDGVTHNLNLTGLKLTVTRKATQTGWNIFLNGETPNGKFQGTYHFKNVAHYPSELVIAELDPTNSAPEIMFSAFSGGAHCCEMPVIYEEVEPGNWVFVEHKMNDATPPNIEDLDQDGMGELITFDQSFLYAFDSYVRSYSPIKVELLRHGNFIDVTKTKSGLKRLRKQLVELEDSAKSDPDLWQSNGFLAAWVALKSILGEGEEAWRRMFLFYDRDNGFETYECSDKSIKVYECPMQKRLAMPYPEALKRLLIKQKYWDFKTMSKIDHSRS
jgi:hypothetical protein